MITCDHDRITVQGSLTIDNVVEVTLRGLELFDQPRRVIDLEKINEVDSTVISMMLEWLRLAHKKGCQLQFVNLPQNLKSLIQLYGIADLIPIDASPR